MDANRRDVATALRTWLDAGRPAALATVVSSSGSAPRGLGAQLAIAGEREWIGALSGGCTENAVIAEAMRLLAGSDERAGAYVAYSKETLEDIGPVCGATLGVVVERVDEALLAALELATGAALAGHAAELRVAWRWDGDAPAATEGAGEPGRAWHIVRVDATGGAEPGEPDAAGGDAAPRVVLERSGEQLSLVQRVEAARHLVLGGAGDIARELVLVAERLAWRTTIVDPRRALLEQTLRRCHPTRTVAAWSDSAWDALGVDASTACVALAHESHVDEPFLVRALTSDAAYVGAVGSRRVQAERRAALEPKVGAEVVARLHGPAGLDLGGHAAAEIALAIAAEIVAVGNGRGGGELARSTGAIRAR